MLENLTTWAEAEGMDLRGLIRSPITGPAGNVEFLAHWVPGGADAVDTALLIKAAVEPAGGDIHA